MKPGTALLALIAVLALTMSITAPSQAAFRTWVASTGLDSNPCTRAAPCATFLGAYKVTDAGGEINCVDGGSYGGLEILQSLTISCVAGTAAVISNFFDPIIVDVGPTDTVYLRGLDIEGSFNASGPVGIYFGSHGALHVEKCLIRGFYSNGIEFQPDGNAFLFVEDTVLSNNGTGGSGAGIVVDPLASAPIVSVSLERVKMVGNYVGFEISNNGTTTVHTTVQDSSAAGGTKQGFYATSSGGRTTLAISRSASVNNGTTGVEADGSNTEVHLGGSFVHGNGQASVIASSGTLVSYKNNEIDLNGSNGPTLGPVNLE